MRYCFRPALGTVSEGHSHLIIPAATRHFHAVAVLSFGNMETHTLRTYARRSVHHQEPCSSMRRNHRWFDSARREDHFGPQCSTCRGAGGKVLRFDSAGALSTENPQ